ncbi:shikimate dehydrogenase [Methylocella sp.]|uniref:shikimate dehydrogenase n=1 Tax=Methylocella sp. TaxID=1978226 RepID=UPI0037831E6D
MSAAPSEGPRAFVAGWPAAHSRSPLIHSYWLRENGLPGSYVARAVPPPDFPGFLEGLAAEGFVGGNVTLPLKEQAFALAAERTATAQAIGAANTVWLEDGRLIADNTDAEGFLGALDEEAPGWERAPGCALVLGAGGAARAVVAALASRGREIVVLNRTRERAERLAGGFRGATAADWREAPGLLARAAILVNTTSLGMHGQPELDIDLSPLPPEAVVDDIVYYPLETRLIAQARARGLRVAPGLGMLLHQAVPAFARFFGVRPSVSAGLRRFVEADMEKSAPGAAALEKTS